ncbi:MAG: hypothetical protein HY722_16395 [Planctomycetes bacterium]|nr:hypothetical protein [Planctomycetota bacterium]
MAEEEQSAALGSTVTPMVVAAVVLGCGLVACLASGVVAWGLYFRANPVGPGPSVIATTRYTGGVTDAWDLEVESVANEPDGSMRVVVRSRDPEGRPWSRFDLLEAWAAPSLETGAPRHRVHVLEGPPGGAPPPDFRMRFHIPAGAAPGPGQATYLWVRRATFPVGSGQPSEAEHGMRCRP